MNTPLFFFLLLSPLFDRLRGSAGSQAAGGRRLIPARLGEDGGEVGLLTVHAILADRQLKQAAGQRPLGGNRSDANPAVGVRRSSGAAQGHWVPASSRRGRAAYEIRSLLRPPAANLKRDDHQATPGGGVQLWVHVAALTLLRCREGCSWD